jgi:hypothetical protein
MKGLMYVLKVQVVLKFYVMELFDTGTGSMCLHAGALCAFSLLYHQPNEETSCTEEGRFK